MRYLRTVERPADSALIKLAAARWDFDRARDPETYTTSTIGRVTLQRDVLTVYARSGNEVLTRYRLLRRPGTTLCSPERDAYACLREL